MAYPTDRSRIAFIIIHLTGSAEGWAAVEWDCHSSACESLERYTTAPAQACEDFSLGREVARALGRLRQEDRQVEYAREFRTLAAESNWDQEALVDAFLSGLAVPARNLLSTRDLPSNLDKPHRGGCPHGPETG